MPRRSHNKIASDKQRQCLRCNKMFGSTGPGNRICGKCNSANAQFVDRVEAQVVPSQSNRLGGG